MMNDIFQSARRACHFEVKSRTGHFPAAFLASIFLGVISKGTHFLKKNPGLVL